ncbi:uncharacterized protein [Palaemon carinicauda]|uniref:uncharacterized protein n=1 Tax=Palaemon carinicauda TaxID=392227 RepID=UPI0035B5DA56
MFGGPGEVRMGSGSSITRINGHTMALPTPIPGGWGQHLSCHDEVTNDLNKSDEGDLNADCNNDNSDGRFSPQGELAMPGGGSKSSRRRYRSRSLSQSSTDSYSTCEYPHAHFHM